MSVTEDMRKVLQDFLAPELRSISVRMEALEKQRLEDKADLLKQRAEDKAELLTQRAEDKVDILRAIADSTVSMQKRFELVIDYTKVLQSCEMFVQTVLPIEDAAHFATVKASLEPLFSPGKVAGYLKQVQRAKLRVHRCLKDSSGADYWAPVTERSLPGAG